MDSKQFGLYMAKLREEAGYKSQAGLARASNIKNSTIARIESGQTKNPKPATLKALAPYLNVDPDEILSAAGYLSSKKDVYEKPKSKPDLANFIRETEYLDGKKLDEKQRKRLKQNEKTLLDMIKALINY